MSQVLIRLLGGDPTNRENPLPKGGLPQQWTAILSQHLRGPPAFLTHSSQQNPLPYLALHLESIRSFTGVLCLSPKLLLSPASCHVHINAGGHQVPSLVSLATSLRGMEQH